MPTEFRNIGSFNGDGGGMQTKEGSGMQTNYGLGSNAADVSRFDSPMVNNFPETTSAGPPSAGPITSGGFMDSLGAGFGAIGGAINGAASALGSSLAGMLDPSKARAAMTGLLSGSGSALASATGVQWLDTGSKAQSGAGGATLDDWRVRVSVSPKAPILYNIDGNALMKPILDTSGVVFPITPQIQLTFTAKYSSQSLTHSNYAMQFYEGSEISTIQINGEFPIQNIEEGQYLLAAIYFFRAATKMFWGKDAEAGAPPPMVFLDGYGSHYFPHVPCVVTQFMHTMPEDKDFIEVPSPGNSSKITRLPTQSTIQVVLQPVYSRASLKDFTMKDFAKGGLLNKGFM